MEVPVGVYETCVLRAFLFLTQITEQYLDVMTTVEEGVAGFPIISDSEEIPEQQGRHGLRLMLQRAGGLIRQRRLDHVKGQT